MAGRENLALSFAMFAQASPTNALSVDAFRQEVERLVDLVGGPGDRAEALELAGLLLPHVVNEKTGVVLGGPDVTPEQFVGMLASPCLQETGTRISISGWKTMWATRQRTAQAPLPLMSPIPP